MVYLFPMAVDDVYEMIHISGLFSIKQFDAVSIRR